MVQDFLKSLIQGTSKKEGGVDGILKICVLGSGNLKRRMIGSFTTGKYDRDYYSIHGVDITTRGIRINDRFVKLIVFDINPKEFFRKLRPSYYRGSSALCIVFEKTDKSSFETVKHWFDEFMESFSSSLPIGLVGLITNTEKITLVEGQELAAELGASYYETIVDDLEYIEHIFHDLTLKALRMKKEIVEPQINDIFFVR